MATEDQLVSHARRELHLIGESDEVIEAYVAVIKAFINMRHSGASADVAIRTITKLFKFENLTPLYDIPNHWNEVGEGVWQSARNPEAFSEDGGVTFYLLSECRDGIKPLQMSVINRQTS